MALLVEGLGSGGDTSIEEYIIGAVDDLVDINEGKATDEDQIRLYGSEQGLSWVARPVPKQSLVSRQGSMQSQISKSFMDPMVTLFGSVHEKIPENQGSMRSMLFPNFGSMFSMAEAPVKNEHWDEESVQVDDEDSGSDATGEDSDENLRSPLLRQNTSMDKDITPPISQGSILGARQPSSLMRGNDGEPISTMGIGGGWQLGYKWSEREGEDGRKEGGFKRIYLHEDGVPGSHRGSLLSLPGGSIPEEGQFVEASVVVSQSALYKKELMEQQSVDPAMLLHPSEASGKGPKWADLLEPGVKHALIVGVGIQILQQFSGINGVLYYTPQILKQAGVEVLLSNLGIGSDSASLLISGFTTLLMLPCIGVAMRLMDIAGRRRLLLTTIPVLIVSLIILVISNLVPMNSVLHAALSTTFVIAYFCCFVAGFGPIPNILCAEIFPTRVRGLCIAICSLVFWFGDITVTYTLPVMLNSIGLAGVFGIYAVVCLISWVFIFAKVPETKGMPLEVIIEFFSVGAKQAAKKD
ncbi:hypothetical protein AQUCO_01500280v1 [Aquilegia coerulea]|nr:hypothetical protein AQUCO_01500280v1 [Aquilegia coerulea]